MEIRNCVLTDTMRFYRYTTLQEIFKFKGKW